MDTMLGETLEQVAVCGPQIHVPKGLSQMIITSGTLG